MSQEALRKAADPSVASFVVEFSLADIDAELFAGSQTCMRLNG
ncbi:hypothetical protein ABIF44_007178 [Bradyrhizobium japonicum]|nr:hypothetical protein [Bradyrhizobium japonicum]BAL13158.1 hypothetical protein BJ6T_79120 [Bradyrhizobium japonicum USDA 6]MCS3986542.1 hypothetical protein [Bradyrhizobium japonicum]MCS4018644.1 hypothetical protein [Bradyrhizobium japonicum]MCS4205750.1 hypothetical protein [Bradyrhizobium japonicum]